MAFPLAPGTACGRAADVDGLCRPMSGVLLRSRAGLCGLPAGWFVILLSWLAFHTEQGGAGRAGLIGLSRLAGLTGLPPTPTASARLFRMGVI